ncbi:STM3941 family protein [Dyella sp.]|uniref:STM3941 family protein n=1 Tax=Dyella sp. TaxID=1869338 RepID=UPI002B4772E3|nr:STM3941 family protein [Dyella sp.]HKT27274.1 STM3941 family protein [Dyella sp.]
MTPIAIRASRRRYALWLIMSSGFVLTGAFMVAFGDTFQTWLGLAYMMFFGAGVLLFLWQLVDARPRLVIDDRGVFDRTLGVGVIPWSDIGGAYVRSIYSVDVICLQLRDPRPWLQRLSPIKRALAPANKALGFTPLSLNLDGVAADVRQVHELIVKMAAAR